MLGQKIITFGEKLAQFQIENNLTTNQLAAMVSVNPNFIRMLIRKTRFPGKHLLETVCREFDEPMEKWEVTLRWEKEKDLELKDMLAIKLLRDWYSDQTFIPTERSRSMFFNPQAGQILPVFHLEEALILYRNQNQAISVSQLGKSDGFWIRVTGDNGQIDGARQGDLLLVEDLNLWRSHPIPDGKLVLAVIRYHGPVLRRYSDGGKYFILSDDADDNAKEDILVLKYEEVPLFLISCLLRVE